MKYLFLGLKKARGPNPGSPQSVSILLDEKSDEEASETIDGHEMLVSGTLYRLEPVRKYVSTVNQEAPSRIPLFFER